MKTYELTYIISPEITSEEAITEAKNIESFVQAQEGVILRQNNPTARTLSYPIKKQASGFMGVLEFQIEPEKLSELKEKIDKDEKIVRHMVIIKKPVKERKTRKTRVKAEPIAGIEMQDSMAKEELSPIKTLETKTKKKVELKDIEKKLDEILGK